MASKEAIEYGENIVCKKLCKTCILSVTGTKCNSYRFAVDAFDAGVESVPSDSELVDEIQVLRERINELENQLGQLKI